MKHMGGSVAKRMNIPLDIIKASPYQPRLFFGLDDIKGSVIRDGILVALTVRWKAGVYELVDGERRWRIAKELGFETVPCDVIDIDDDSARRMVWKVNALRRDYAPKEKALFFKTMREEYGMNFTSIAREFDIDLRDVKAYLNVFKMPEEYQLMVWEKVIPIRNIRELDQLFNRVELATPEGNPEIFKILDRSVEEKHFGAEQIREALKPYLTRLRQEQIEQAQGLLAKVKPQLKAPKTPEELEEAAKVLKSEARRRRTPEQKLEDDRSKARKARDSIIQHLSKSRELVSTNEYGAEIKKLEITIEEDPNKAISKLKTLKRQLQFDRARSEKRRLEQEARVKARAELMKDQMFLRRVAEISPQKRAIEDWREKEVPARGPDKKIVTEDVWECPICHVRHRLLHLEPRGHKLEELRGD